MKVEAGSTLGPYEILAFIGAGGMGEVYRARDTRLNREVAVKVLPAALANDADRLRRFEQEARATSALNHPNILTVHDVGSHQGMPFLVAEMLEGEELRAVLRAGPLAWHKAVEYARQVAAGLAAAHDKGIVHRDLKPENIFITRDGRVKILDFGLAKLRQQQTGLSPASLAGTQPAITDPGAVLGTVGYMSPEQVHGKEADHRADIFGLGLILYEMLAGKSAFEGGSAAATMSAILRDEPASLSEENARIPLPLDRIVRRCLEKKREQRFQSAGDLGFSLETLSEPSGSRMETAATLPAPVKASAARALSKREMVAWLTAAVLLLVALLSVTTFRQAAGTALLAEVRLMKFALAPPEKASFSQLAVSPDGRYLAFTAAQGARVQLWVRALDSLTARILPGTDGAAYPFWSPDSRFIAFFTGSKLRKIEVAGGPVQTLCDVRIGNGGAWSREGGILFASLGGGGISQVPEGGGEPHPVVLPDWANRETDLSDPSFLPDGKHFLFYVLSGQRESRGIYVGSLDAQMKRRLLGDESNAVYAPPASPGGKTGYLLYGREAVLMAQPFDAGKMLLSGEPVPIAESVGTIRGSTAGFSRRGFSVSNTGVLVLDPSPNRQQNRLAWVDRRGRPAGPAIGLDNVIMHKLSSDERRIAMARFDLQTGNSDVWISSADGGNLARFTFDPGNDHFPIWSPGGDRIAWCSNRSGRYQMYQKAATGSGEDTLLLKMDRFSFPTDWSEDGRFLVYRQVDPKTRYDLWILPLSGDLRPIPFLQTQANETAGALSPDQRWLAYCSDESGNYEIYVQSFPTGGGKRQISTAGGIGPQWRADGKELFYQAPDGKLMAVTVLSGAAFEAGTAVPLFEFRPGSNLIYPHYSVTRDGQRFLLGTMVDFEASAPLTVMVNWATELKK